jgi:plasmid stabilization system protein ParE
VPLNPQGAERVRTAIAETIDSCERNPKTGTVTDEPGLFRRPLRKYAYTIFYRSLATGEGIEIVRILHGARVKKLGTPPTER